MESGNIADFLDDALERGVSHLMCTDCYTGKRPFPAWAPDVPVLASFHHLDTRRIKDVIDLSAVPDFLLVEELHDCRLQCRMIFGEVIGLID